MTASQIKRLFQPGQVVTVTNHYINKPDHPCFGTHPRTIAKVSGSHLHFTWADRTDSVPWPKAANLRVNDSGAVEFHGFPVDGALFLTIQL
jgi:hypothetical protein